MQTENHDPSRLLIRHMSRRTLLRGSAAGVGWAGLTAIGCGTSKNGSVTRSPASATPAGPPVKLNVADVGVPFDIPLFLARDLGIFQKNGIDVTAATVAGPTSVASLLSGQIQFDHPGGSEVLAALANGADLVVVAVQSTVFNFKFYARPTIKSVGDLKGKKVGITSPGGAFDISLRAALPKFGLEPDKDVTFIASGSIANVTAALLSGAIDGASIVVGPDSHKLETTGLQPLFDFATLNLEYCNSVITLQRSYLASHRDLVQRYIDSMIVGIARYKQDKPTSLQELAKLYQTDDQVGLNVAYDYYTQDSVMPRLPYPKPEQFKISLDVLCKKVQNACNYDVSKVLDTSFVQSAANRGLDKVTS